MRLLTHNQLVCGRKGCDDAFPFQLTFEEVEQNETEPNLAMVLHLLSRVDYPVLYGAAVALGIDALPAELPSGLSIETHRELLETLHTVMFDIEVIKGSLKCPVCSHVYHIQEGIANIRLNESEL